MGELYSICELHLNKAIFLKVTLLSGLLAALDSKSLYSLEINKGCPDEISKGY